MIVQPKELATPIDRLAGSTNQPAPSAGAMAATTDALDGRPGRVTFVDDDVAIHANRLVDSVASFVRAGKPPVRRSRSIDHAVRSDGRRDGSVGRRGE